MTRHAAWWAALAALLLVAGPPFVCMELHNDTLLFDTYARTLQRGGVLYRDCCETNLPGMTWLHLGLRSAVGWRPEPLRAIDLAVMGACVALLALWVPGVAAGWRFGLALALLVFYVTLSGWCHVQRDPWMLLPALLALHLRRTPGRPARAFAEGLLWAAAFWIKPFVAVPGLLVWLTAAMHDRRAGASWGRLLRDGLAVLAGGVAGGAAGVAWLAGTGAWPHFVEMATVWNPEYFQYDVTGGERGRLLLGFAVRFFPWILIHAVAVPVALRQLWAGGRPAALLAALYLGWLGQAVLLQHIFDYVQLPAVLLAFAVVLGHAAAGANPLHGRLFAGFLAACVLARAAPLAEHLDTWPRCWREGSSPAVRDRLNDLPKIRWQELARTADYLRGRGVGHGELTCFNMPTAALYRELDVEASTRYHFFQNNWLSFRRQRPRIYSDLATSRQRFVVIDLNWKGTEVPLDRLDAPGGPPLPPRWDRWKGRIVFRAERYAVLEIPAAEGPAWVEECFGD